MIQMARVVLQPAEETVIAVGIKLEEGLVVPGLQQAALLRE
jgi:hypothetical protein